MAEQVQVTPSQLSEEKPLSFQDFLKLYDGQHAELVMGKVYIYMSNSQKHQDIFVFLITLLSLKNIGKLVAAGFSMYISDDQPIREPDLMIVLNEHLDRLKETYLNGTADVAIEIVSPESTDRDRGVKFAEYEQAGVPEYWIIDPLRSEILVYSLGDDQRYHRRELDSHGQITSPLLPGFALEAAILWRKELPAGKDLIHLLEQMGAM